MADPRSGMNLTRSYDLCRALGSSSRALLLMPLGAVSGVPAKGKRLAASRAVAGLSGWRSTSSNQVAPSPTVYSTVNFYCSYCWRREAAAAVAEVLGNTFW
jgi:hypothetical protein